MSEITRKLYDSVVGFNSNINELADITMNDRKLFNFETTYTLTDQLFEILQELLSKKDYDNLLFATDNNKPRDIWEYEIDGTKKYLITTHDIIYDDLIHVDIKEKYQDQLLDIHPNQVHSLTSDDLDKLFLFWDNDTGTYHKLLGYDNNKRIAWYKENHNYPYSLIHKNT